MAAAIQKEKANQYISVSVELKFIGRRND